MPNTLPVYVPQNLEIDKILVKNPPNFSYDVDYFKYIINLVTEIPSNNKDILDNNHFVPINAFTLQKRIRNYNLYIEYLLQNGVFQTDNQYIPDEKSRGYRFTKEFCTPIKVGSIVKKTLVKSICTKSKSEVNGLKKYKNLKKWFNDDLEINFEAATTYLTKKLNIDSQNGINNAMLKFNASYRNAHKIQNKDFSFIVDSTVGRLHTNLTMMKSELRNFITYNGQKMASIDIKTSQPFFSTILLNEEFYTNKMGENISTTYNLNEIIKSTSQITSNNNFKYIYKSNSISSYIMLVKMTETPENNNMQHYKSLVEEGALYEYMASEIEKRTGEIITDRKQLKSIIFTILFTDNRFIGQPEAVYKRIFRELFPTVYDIFKLIKTKDSSTLPCLLQTVESHLILDIISKKISQERPEMPLFTIHDSIACPVGDEEYVKQVMQEEIKRVIGINPTLKPDYWTPENLK